MSAPSRIGTSLEFGSKGKRWGRLSVPYSQHLSAYGHIPIPIAVIVGRPGPTVLLSGGVHGDEYEGQIELANLVASIDPAEVTGRLIVLPSANLPAALAHSRTSPIDQGNLARLFPGERDGTITRMIAHYIETELMPLADRSLDLHAGGSSLDYLPCTLARVPEPNALEETRANLMAFGAPYACVSQTGRRRDGTVSPADDRTLLAAAVRRGIPAMAVELGGQGTATPATLSLTRRGLTNMLAHWGVLPRSHFKQVPSIVADIRPEHHIFAPRRGVFAPLFTLGEHIEADSVVGHIHDLEQPEDAPRPVVAQAGGVVICRRVSAQVEPGDCLFQLCEPVELSRLPTTA